MGSLRQGDVQEPQFPRSLVVLASNARFDGRELIVLNPRP